MSLPSRALLSLIVVAAGSVACTTPLGGAATARAASVRAAYDALPTPALAAGVTMLDDNGDAWAARWELLSAAHDEIDATYFIVDTDAFGMAFLGKLLDRAEHGVAVHLLVDARGSRPLATDANDFLQELVQSGADVRVFNPVLPQVLNAVLRARATPVASGTHNKILVVDGQIAVTGGRNISRHYYAAAAEDDGAVADADVLIDGGDAVAALAAVVAAELAAKEHEAIVKDIVNLVPRRDELLLLAAAMDAWIDGVVDCRDDGDALLARAVAATGVEDAAAIAAARARVVELAAARSLCGRLPTRASPRFDVEARVIAGDAAAHRRLDERVSGALLTAIKAARDSVIIESPYFIVTPALLEVLEDASRRGVAITLLTNSPLSSDNALSQALFIDSWPELVAHAQTLRVFVDGARRMQHGKRVVVDDALTFIGSCNIDPFSLHVNSETLVAIWSPQVAAQTRQTLLARRDGGTMLEYRVARDVFGVVRRGVSATANTGVVIVDFGPADHVPAETLAELRALKWLLIAQRRLWDFDVVVW